MEPRPAPTLDRGLGLLEATTLVAGGIIGASIFLVPADVAREVGAPGLMLTAWVLSGLLALFGALCFAELAAAIPETGGTYAFLKRAYPTTPVAFLFGWMMCFTYATGAIAVVAAMAAVYAGELLGRVLPYGPAAERLVAATVILGLTGVNYVGVRVGGRTQDILTALKVGLMLVLIVLGLALGSGSVATLRPFAPPDQTTAESLGSLGAAMLLTLFAYSGAYFVTHVAGEVRNPTRAIPRAIAFGMAIVFVLYLAINVAYLRMLSFDELRVSQRVAADAAAAVIGPMGASLTALTVTASAIGTLNAQLLNYPRIVFALARDGLFFRRLGAIQPARRTPAAAILLVGGWATGFALLGSYQQILNAVGFVIQLFLSLAVAAVIVLRAREPALPRPYRVWGYPWTPLLFLAISAWYLVTLLMTRLGPTLAGIGIVAAGLPFYYYWSRRAAHPFCER